MEMSLLWCGSGDTHGFFIGGKTYRQEKATAEIPEDPAFFGVKITMSFYARLTSQNRMEQVELYYRLTFWSYGLITASITTEDAQTY